MHTRNASASISPAAPRTSKGLCRPQSEGSRPPTSTRSEGRCPGAAEPPPVHPLLALPAWFWLAQLGAMLQEGMSSGWGPGSPKVRWIRAAWRCFRALFRCPRCQPWSCSAARNGSCTAGTGCGGLAPGGKEENPWKHRYLCLCLLFLLLYFYRIFSRSGVLAFRYRLVLTLHFHRVKPPEGEGKEMSV